MTQPYTTPTLSELARGVDVSYWQNPRAVNWYKLAETHAFVYVRATYGTKVDPSCAEHLTRARDAGLCPGIYHFFRPKLGAREQLDAFGDVAASVGLTDGWLAPALDVEQDKNDGEVTPARYAHAEEMVRSWAGRWGRAVIYTNPATWRALGDPEYLKSCDLWISHYGVKLPRTPLGLPWLIWQHLVDTMPGTYSGHIDQNLARALPILGKKSRASAESVPSLLPIAVDWEEQAAARDLTIKDEDT